MANGPDLFARLLGAASFSVALYALWLNRQKNERDLAAQRPQFTISADKRGIRLWWVKLTVMNLRPVPIAWRRVAVVRPIGGLLVDHNARQTNEDANYPIFSKSNLSNIINLPTYPTVIGPSETKEWEGWLTMDELYGLRKAEMPFVVPVIDGYDLRPSFFRRLASWIWPKAIKM